MVMLKMHRSQVVNEITAILDNRELGHFDDPFYFVHESLAPDYLQSVISRITDAVVKGLGAERKVVVGITVLPVVPDTELPLPKETPAETPWQKRQRELTTATPQEEVTP